MYTVKERTAMNIKDYVSQYKNAELCAKWENNIPASELQGDFILIDLTQDVREICNHFSFLPREDIEHGGGITAALAIVRDGDYKEIYVTESSAPYFADAIYHPLDYYL